MNNNKYQNKSIKHIIQHQKRLVSSSVFKNSDQYSKLFNFLVEKHFEETPKKESFLEVSLPEIFGANNSYNSKVRVYMHNLRKKLEEYYRTEGINDAFIFSIEKGQYNLSITKKKVTKNKIHLKKSIFPIAIGLVTVWVVFLINSNNNAPYLWKNFIDNSTPTVCYIGDHYTVWGKVDDTLYASVHFEGINSKSQFESLLHKNLLKDSHFKSDNYSFVTKMGPLAASKLTYWFSLFNEELRVQLESDFEPSNINNEIVIFIGPHKTMGELKSVFLYNSQKFATNSYNFINKTTGKEYTDITENDINIEHVMVSYTKLSDTGRKALFFSSNHDVGVMATVRNFTNEDRLKEFYEAIPNNSYFNALFKVRGIGRTNVECQLIELEIIK